MQNNHFINQPLAIDKGYLTSVLTGIIMSYQKENFLSELEIEAVAMHNIELQAAEHQSNGSESFPVVLNIIGPIIKYSSWNYLGTQSIIKILQRLENDDRVIAVVLNIDSGGGMVSGTAELCNVLQNFSKPTYAFTNGYMCSAALDIAAACKHRFSHPNADLIGSLGVMMNYQDYSAMFEKWGATIYEVYAPQSTEKNKEFRELLKGDKTLYEERLAYLGNEFIARVKSNIGKSIKDDGKVFKGKTYTPKEALKVGLIDGIATLKEVLTQI
ncbi:S49 family peptidase [Tenacibaculum sp. SSH1-16]|uniref:S49 family peptidase n=1 Tax=Tenacibaculum sp. SSH1-16 TaxID=3136667 RepID=UPI0032C43F21